MDAQTNPRRSEMGHCKFDKNELAACVRFVIPVAVVFPIMNNVKYLNLRIVVYDRSTELCWLKA